MSQRLFSEREQGFESQYVHDQETEFRIHARRDHLFGLWAATQLGYDKPAAEEYAAQLVALDVHPQRPEAVIGRVLQDLAQRVGEPLIRMRFAECAGEARRDIVGKPAKAKA